MWFLNVSYTEYFTVSGGPKPALVLPRWSCTPRATPGPSRSRISSSRCRASRRTCTRWTPARSHLGNLLENPVNHRIGWIQHGKFRFGLAPSASSVNSHTFGRWRPESLQEATEFGLSKTPIAVIASSFRMWLPGTFIVFVCDPEEINILAEKIVVRRITKGDY